MPLNDVVNKFNELKWEVVTDLANVTVKGVPLIFNALSYSRPPAGNNERLHEPTGGLGLRPAVHNRPYDPNLSEEILNLLDLRSEKG